MSPTVSSTMWLPLAFGVIFLANTVLCVNKAPVWDVTSMNKIKDFFSRQVYENTTENKLLGTLLASDPEGKTVTYGVDSENTVRVNPISGAVTLARTLDREKGDSKVDVIFFAYDPYESNVRNTIDYPTRLNVQDINDNAPDFQGIPYGAEVYENTQKDTIIFSKVVIEDLDDGYNAEVFIDCAILDEQSRLACANFGLSSLEQMTQGVFNCSIHTKSSLDYENQTSYIITLRAKDNGNPQLTSLVNVRIKVIDVQDSPPEFLNTPINLYTNESVPANSKIGEIQARDRDQGNPRPVKIVIINGSLNADLFRLVPKAVADPNVPPLVYTYDVISTTTLDRETLKGQAAFDVKAIELENGVETTATATATVLVNIFDVNDNPPRFDQNVYYINASESVRATDHTQIPGLTMTVRDIDDASNARFSVSIQSQTFPGAFAVSPTNATSQGPFALAVINADFMDYEQPSYRNQQVVVVAREIGTSNLYSSSATVFVSLLDVNDNSPVFNQSEYTFTVKENTQAFITSVTATDADSGINGEIRYQIDEGVQTNLNTYFNIVEATGVIRIATPIDYEENREFPLVISATDQGSPKRTTKVVLRVVVENVNDNKPKFVVPSYTTRITETTTVLQPAITVQATDNEEGSGAITYRIVSGNNLPKGPAFFVDPNNGQLSLTRTVNFDETPSERGYFLLVIEASDNGSPVALTERVEVRVNVQDENNYEARFDKLVYSASVSELARVDASVIQVHATDQDKGENGELTYSLQGSLGDFNIDSTSGLIRVSPSARLDSSRALYRLTVVATDNGSPRQRSSTALVNVNIVDKNNKVPSFSEALYTATVSEEESLNTVVLQVTATDPDQNSSLVYSIMESTIRAKDLQGALFNNPSIFNYKASFYIDADDGEVHIRNKLSYENVAEMDFAVLVRDSYAETVNPIQTATASVNIRILGSVDATPRFVAPWRPEDPTYFFTIPEETAKNSQITILVATDPSAQKNIENFVELESVDINNYFSVDRTTGSLLVNNRLDYDTLKSRLLPVEVQAISSDGLKTAIARIRINILDINDNTPKFDQQKYSFEVYESRQYPYLIGEVLATDADSGDYKEISYSLTGQGAENFQILNSGKVIVAQGATINREDRALYDLQVTATDNPGGRTQRQQSVQLIIRILDENDSSPKFNRDSYNFLTVDSTGMGSVIGQVEASDKDTGLNSKVIYTMSCGDPNANLLFVMNIFTGEVTVESRLEGQVKTFLCNVTASDQGKPPRSKTIPLILQVSSGSDNGIPIFAFPDGATGYESNSVIENSPPGVLVGRIFATSLLGNVTYSFVENSDSLVTSRFSIDSSTGEVLTLVTLDREEEASYELLINARVSGNTTLSSVTVLRVQIQDENDNIPLYNGQGCDREIYISPPFRVYPQEGTKNGTRLKVLSACDRDDPADTETNYAFVSRLDNPGLTALNPDCVTEENSFYRLVKIDKTKVAIVVDKPLDHDIPTNGKQLLCIQARDAKELSTNGRKKRATYNQLEYTVAYIEVNIVDINDNGPVFKEKLMQAVILEFPSADQIVKQVTATDMDSPPYDRVRYSIQSTTFVAQDNSLRNITIAFDIDSFTGEVQTKLVRYTQFISGRFDITIRAEDSLRTEYSNTAMLQVSVLQVGQRLKVTWTNTNGQQGDASLMNDVQKDIQGAVSRKNWQLTVDELRYHIDNKGIKDDSKFDACFVVLDNKGQSPSKDEVMQAIRTSSSLDNTYDVGFCDAETSAGLGGGATYWWVLIALAIIIFVGTIILIIVSLILAARLKNKQDNMKTSLIQN